MTDDSPRAVDRPLPTGSPQSLGAPGSLGSFGSPDSTDGAGETAEVGGGALRDAVVEMTHAQGPGVIARIEGADVVVSRRAGDAEGSGGIEDIGDPAAAGRVVDFLTVTPRDDGGLDLVFRFPAGPPRDSRLEPAGSYGAGGAEEYAVRVLPTDIDAELITLEPLIEAAYAQNA